MISFHSDHISDKLPVFKRGEITKSIGGILKSGHLSPGLSAKMRAMIGFAQTFMFGKFGRSQLQPFSDSQYSRAVRGPHPLNQELREVIPWWVSVLRTVSGRRKVARGPRPAVFYVDAAGCGHIGVCVFIGGQEMVYLPFPRVDDGRRRRHLRFRNGIIPFRNCARRSVMP